MPKSSFIVNSEFQPMSYLELLHPVITQTQYQRELEEKYSQLDLQADKLEQLANSAVDKESYEKYKAYADRLREEASNLSKYGLLGRDNSRFMDLFRRYGREIQPLLDALAKRERLIAMQLQLSMQDPTSLYDRSAGNISLLELMANPSAAPVRQSGELLRALALAMAINLQNELKTAVIKKSDSPGYLAFRLKYGLSSEEVAAFVTNPNSPEASKVLRAIFDLVLNASGVKEYWEGDAYNQAVNYITMGLWSAIGKEAVQPLTDVWGLLKDQQAFQAAEAAKLRAFQAREAAKQRAHLRAMVEEQRRSLGIGNAWVLGNLSPKQQEENRRQLKKWADKNYITLNKDGSIKSITDAGMHALFDKTHDIRTEPVYGHGVQWATRVGSKKTDYGYAYFNQDFYNFMRNQRIFTGSWKENDKLVIDRRTINNNLQRWYTNNELGFDLNYSGKLALNWGPASNGLKNQALASMSDSDRKRAGLSQENFRDILKGRLEYTLTDGNSVVMRIQGHSGEYYDVPITKSMNRTLFQTVTAGAQQAININSELMRIQDRYAHGEPIYLPLGFDQKGKPNGNYTKPASQKEIENFLTYYHGELEENLIPTIYMNQTALYKPMYSGAVKIDPSIGATGMAYYGGYNDNDPYGDMLDMSFGSY